MTRSTSDAPRISRDALTRLAIGSLLLGVAPAIAQGIDFDKTQIRTETVAPNFYALRGSPNTHPLHPDAAGGCIGIFVGSDGVFMVDASYPQLSQKIIDAIRMITPWPIKYLVNTHAHRDHVSGNPNFAKLGATILAREETRQRMDGPQPPEDKVSTTDPARLPTVTYGRGDPVKIRMGSEIVDLIPVGGARTDGDTIIRFEKSDVVMTGDFYRSYGYQFIDASVGGTVEGTIDAIETLLRVSGPGTKFVPGRGSRGRRSSARHDRRRRRPREKDDLRRQDERRDPVSQVDRFLRCEGSGWPRPATRCSTATTADQFVDAVYSELRSKR